MRIPSILNEVIGPVMRGPSSSHCAATVRIGLIGRSLMNNSIKRVLVECDLKGSLATTFISQGSEMGLCGGILGFTADDKRLVSYKKQMKVAGIQLDLNIDNFGDPHPNTYRITLENDTSAHTLTALSTGGGMIEIIKVDDCPMSIKGDCHETLIYYRNDPARICALLGQQDVFFSQISSCKSEGGIIEIKTHAPLDPGLADKIVSIETCCDIKQLPSVLPILTVSIPNLPFETLPQLTRYSLENDADLGESALIYESRRGNTTKEYVLNEMIAIVRIIENAIKQGIDGTQFRDRILHQQSDRFLQSMKNNTLLDTGLLNTIILNVTAIMEVKSAMGVIVAAPTAGSCGALPGTIIGAARSLGYDDKKSAMAMLAAGMVGVFIARDATFAAEVGGCQAECGAASGMAAAGLVTLMGGSTKTALAAASMALQNIFGMTCDPVANRVEVPCLGKNILAASNAVSCANLALAGFDQVIPLDEVIFAMDKVGKSIHHDLRCTAKGGLSVSPTSKRIEAQLKAQSRGDISSNSSKMNPGAM